MVKRIVKRMLRFLASYVFRKLKARRMPTRSVYAKPIVNCSYNMGYPLRHW